MGAKRMTAQEKIQRCLIENKSFVVQGGAGSGKTETLKKTLEFISAKYPDKKIACITHTNLAVEEIESRVGPQYTISTIHSFLNGFISDYKINMHQVIHKLFQVEAMVRHGVDVYGGDEVLQKKKEHEKYKKIHKKYSAMLFLLRNERTKKVEGKKEYDQDPQGFNKVLNSQIGELNSAILEHVREQEYTKIEYNETRFNSFNELTFGHDGLLDIAYFMFEEYPILGKVLKDKYDFIFIDEYPDAKAQIIDILINKYVVGEKNLLGLFGDSMQAIYEDGIGNVEKYVGDKVLTRIDKEDNYRSSKQVIDFINKLRNDKLVQEVAYKKKDSGEDETLEDRQGSVTLYYSLYEGKPHVRSPQENKDEYLKVLEDLIMKALEGENEYRQLKLTNKAMANNAGFGKLNGIFSDRFVEPIEYIDKHLGRLQFTDLFELCDAYKPLNGAPNYNLVLSKLKKHGFAIKSIADKKSIKEKFDIIMSSDQGAYQTLNKAYDLQLLKRSESHLGYLEQREKFFSEIEKNSEYQKFKALYLEGKNTLNRIKDDLPSLDEEDFSALERDVKKDIFFNAVFSPELKFKEIMNYCNYQNEKTPYITMHKTKGSGIDNVLVVLDEYFWSEYNFGTVFSKNAATEKKEKNEKLVYVACSRTKKNLKCVRLVSGSEEVEELKSYFDNMIMVNDSTSTRPK